MKKRPNIILFTTDQQRYDTCGMNAPSFMRTPHFDFLAGQGTTFSRAYADCPICVPSRTTIMSGKAGYTHGMCYNGETSDVLGTKDTLPTLLYQAGYQTCAIGKMHFGPERTRHGFQEMILPTDYYNEMAKQGGTQPMRHGLGQNELYPGMSTVEESRTLTNWIADKSLDYIKERRDPSLPFFLWCSFTKPHPPLDPPEPYYSMYRDCDIPEPETAFWNTENDCPPAFLRQQYHYGTRDISDEIVIEARKAYLGLITQVDYNMGRVLSALQDDNMLDETMIIYTSDHGEFIGDFHAGNKGFFYEAASHIPFVVKYPKSWNNDSHGKVVDTPISLADVLPTIVSAAGKKVPKSVDGTDLATLLDNKKEVRYIEGQADAGWMKYHAITDGKYKYIFYPEGGCEQFFDLSRDHPESINRIDYLEVRKHVVRLRKELISRLAKRNSPYVRDNKFLPLPVVYNKDTPREIRNDRWPGFHSEHYGVDVRH